VLPDGGWPFRFGRRRPRSRGGNGDDVATAAQRRGIRVLLTSGHPDQIIKLENGPFPFISKPYSANDLIAVMKALLSEPDHGA